MTLPSFLKQKFQLFAALAVITGSFIAVASPVSARTIYITPDTLPSTRVGANYSQTLTANGGIAPFEWTIVSGQLPVGLSLDYNTGVISGRPQYNLTYTFVVRVKDSTAYTATKSYDLVVDRAAVVTPPGLIDPTIVTPLTPVASLNITSSAVANGRVGNAYSTTLSATGGRAPYTWNFASGALPPGLRLDSNGTISGTPTTAGTYTAYLEVFDASSTFVGRSFTFTIEPSLVVTPPTITLPPSVTLTPVVSADVTARLNTLSRLGISVNALIKLPDDGNRFTQADSAVYYVGSDGRRHAFPNDRVYATWYTDFSGVRVVSATDLASIPLGANVTYKPGMKLVQFQTDPKVYAVSSNRTLRWVKTQTAAEAIYGSDWNHQVDDISDTFYLDYTFGTDIGSSSDYTRTSAMASVHTVSDVLPL